MSGAWNTIFAASTAQNMFRSARWRKPCRRFRTLTKVICYAITVCALWTRLPGWIQGIERAKSLPAGMERGSLDADPNVPAILETMFSSRAGMLRPYYGGLLCKGENQFLQKPT